MRPSRLGAPDFLAVPRIGRQGGDARLDPPFGGGRRGEWDHGQCGATWRHADPKLLRNYAPEKHPHLGKNSLLGRFALPKDHGEAVAFLASREAEYITGAALAVDGGSSIFPGNLAAYLKARAEMIVPKK